ncbi:sugar ABC transporter ATP-binding protein [Cellulomonas fimi]|uniref:Sugar ABC transporter ATP-binding protein n=2 Tax=Cellulomonas fimi TaxID=1708 RepID=A0A7Y0QHJ2_CELFI|nr:sugar ABC transporter ATP-binding protein [Cellulomonas fimi]
MGDELIRLEKVTKRFAGVLAVDEVDLQVHAGEVHVLLGENGAGKSTLIKMLAGVHHPDSGDIRVRGQETRIDDAHHAHRLGIATIYQEFNLVPELSVAENILLGRQPHRAGVVSARANRRQVRPLLQRVGLDVDPARPVSSLGVARQQLVEIAKALSLDARILVLDEPTAALTDQEVDRLFEVMESLRADGVGQIFISHHLGEVPRIGDRVSILRDGRKVAEVPADTDEDELVRLMVGRDIDAQYPRRRHVAGQGHAPLLQVRGLTRRGAFEDITFDVRRGEILGIAGLVGAGRTEVIRAIAGADNYHSGEVLAQGKPVPRHNVHAAVAAGIGHVPEDRKTQGLVLGADVAENVSLANLRTYTRGGFVDQRRVEDDARRVTARLRVRMRNIRQSVQTLSGGNQQKVVFGKWVLAGAKILLLDEPTRGVDVGARVEIYEIINELTASGGAVVMVSSDLPEILGMADRIIVMSDGRVSGEMSFESASQESIMALAVKEVESSRAH